LILTLTPNPSLDLLFEADTLVWDDANRVAAPRRRPGGQGVNVTRAVRALGGRSTALAVLGGPAGRELAAALAAEGTPLRAVPIAGETRTFVAVRERGSGRSLLINPRGPACSPEEVEAVRAALDAALAELRPDWVAACGSLPPGFPPDFYADAGRRARAAGARFVADCDGEALRRAVAAGVCDALVPNRHEAGRLLGREVADPAAAGRAAADLAAWGVPIVAVKLGPAGAVAAGPDGVLHGAAPGRRDGSAVGAGDAFLAALLLALGEAAPPATALARAIAAGTAVLDGAGDTLLDARAAADLAGAVGVRALRP
jgi:1-phosphofructokinase family hexose kinase